MTTPRVLVVEDNPATAAFLDQQLSGGGLLPEVVRGGLQALRRAHGRDFALAIVDVDIASEPNGVETADWLHRLYGVPVIVFSMRSEAESRAQAAVAGAAGYLARLEAGALSSLVSSLLTRRRRREASEEVGEALGGGGIAEHAVIRPLLPPGNMPVGFAELSGREWQIIRDLIEQPSAQAVAVKRQLSPHTVHNHLKSIFKKLDIHSVAELLSLMLRVQRQASQA